MDEQSSLPALADAAPTTGKWPPSSKALWTLLTQVQGTGIAVEEIAKTPALRAEANAIVAELEAAKEKVDRVDFVRTMGRQKIVFGLGSWSATEWSQALSIYFDALADFSAVAIEEAFSRWHRGEGMSDPGMAQFFPKPAQLVALATKARAEIWVAAHRARQAVEHREAPTPQMIAGDQFDVQEGFKKLLEEMQGRSHGWEPSRPTIPQYEMADRIRAHAARTQAPEEPSDDPGIVL